MDFQEIIFRLDRYWARQGCALLPPGGQATPRAAAGLCLAGASRLAGADGLEGLYRYRVLLAPAPAAARRLFLNSLREAGLDRSEHDLRWAPRATSGAAAAWEVLLDGLPLAGFSYRAAAGGAVSAEVSVSLERLALASQKKRRAGELCWSGRLTYGELHPGEAA